MLGKQRKILKRIIALVSVLALFVCSGCANGGGQASKDDRDYRICITGDVHYTTLQEWYGVPNADRLQLWVDAIWAEHEEQPFDLIIINGDTSLDYWATGGSVLTRGISETQLFVEEYVSQLPEDVPVIILPGNHEAYGDENWQAITGNSRNETFVLGNNLFIMPDSYGANLDPDSDSDGKYTPLDADFIQAAIDEYPDHNVYIISHYIDPDNQTGEFWRLLRDNENIKGLFSGHTHGAKMLTASLAPGMRIAQTGNFCQPGSNGEEDNFWGFRDLVITSEHATSNYLTAECDVLINAEFVHFDRDKMHTIQFY